MKSKRSKVGNFVCTAFQVVVVVTRTHTITHMALGPDVEKVVKDWLAINNNIKKECKGLERDPLIRQLTTLDRRDVDEKHSLLDEDARRAKYKDEDQITFDS